MSSTSSIDPSSLGFVDTSQFFTSPSDNGGGSLLNLGSIENLGTPIDTLASAVPSISGLDSQTLADIANLSNTMSSISGSSSLPPSTFATPKSAIDGSNLYSVSPTQTGSVIAGQGDTTGLAATNPSLNSVDTSGNANYSIAGNAAGIDPNTGTGFGTPTSIAAGGPNLNFMGGGQGLTSYIPPQFNSDGTVQQGTGGTLTSSGFIPDNASINSKTGMPNTPTVALGNPNSYINNPNLSGNSAVVSPNTVVTPTTNVKTPGSNITTPPTVTTTDPKTGTVTTAPAGTNPNAPNPGTTAAPNTGGGLGATGLIALLAALLSAIKGGSSASNSGAYTGGIPTLTATRTQTNAKPPAAGANNVNYFNPVTYAADGGMMYAGGGGIGSLGTYSDGGRMLKGPGDGVSDSIPATIGGHQKAALADGEFVIPARIVSEIGNGSSDAGARKLYAMMEKIQQARKKTTKNVAADTKAEKYLPK